MFIHLLRNSPDMSTNCVAAVEGTSTVTSLPYIVTGAYDCSVTIWDADRLEPKKSVGTTAVVGNVEAVALNMQGDVAIACGDVVLIQHVDEEKPKRVLQHGSSIFGISWSPVSDTSLATASNDTHARIWDLCTGAEQDHKILKGHTLPVKSVAHTADGKKLITCAKDCSVRIWDACTGNCINHFDSHADAVLMSVSSGSDSTLFASASFDSQLRITDIETGRSMLYKNGRSVPSIALKSMPWSVAMAASRVVVGCHDGTISVFDLARFASKISMKAPPSNKSRSNAVPSTDTTSTSSDDGAHASAVESLPSLPQAHNKETAVSLPSCGQDGSRLLDAGAGLLVEERRTVAAHQGPVYSVAMSVCGKYVVSSGEDMRVRLWHCDWTSRSLQCMTTLEHHNAPVTSVHLCRTVFWAWRSRVRYTGSVVYKEAFRCVLLASARLARQRMLAKLPNEIWVHVFTFCSAWWWLRDPNVY